MVGLAVRLCRVRQILQIGHDRLDARLVDVSAGAESLVGRVLVDGARGGVRVCNQVRRRRDRIAFAVAPERSVAGAEHEVVGAGATMERLMEVIAQGEAVSQLLQDRSFLLLGIVEAHRVGHAEVLGIGSHHEGEQVGQTARAVGLGGGGNAAILLLPILVEAVRGIAGVVVVSEQGTLQRERTRQGAGAGNAGIETSRSAGW